MKTRVGFVSNSSSASFILTISGMGIKELYKILEEDGYYTFYDYENEINKKISEIREKATFRKSKNIKACSYLKIREITKVMFLQKELEWLKKEGSLYGKFGSSEDLLTKVFDLEDILVEDNDTYLCLYWSTTMLNDLSTSTSNIIKEILLICARDNYKVELAVKEDH